MDPELGYNIVDLEFIYVVAVKGGGIARITMTTTTPGCPVPGISPMAPGTASLPSRAIQSVEVTLTYEPPWTPQMIAPEAKQHLGIGDGGGW